jgi:uncharacterized protein YhfF
MVRDEPADAGRFLRRYAEATGDEAEPPAFAFGDSPAMADELSALVLQGPKRATAALVAEFEHDGDPIPGPGDRSLVLDGRGKPVCVIETLEIRVGPLGSVDPAFAWDEGEGDRTREDWLDMHRRFFARRCPDLGLEPSEDLPTVFERFRVAWPEQAQPAPLAARRGATVRELRFDERAWAASVVAPRWGGPTVVSQGVPHDLGGLPGLIAERGGRAVGIATFRPWPGAETEIVTLDALDDDERTRRLLVSGLNELGRRAGWRRTVQAFEMRLRLD